MSTWTFTISLTLLAVFLTRLVAVRSKSVPPTTSRCEYYNETQCNQTGEGCNSTQTCEVVEADKRSHCYVLWQNNSNGFTIKMKGCWLNHVACYDKRECVETREEPKKQLYFCCCEGDLCNRNMSYEPIKFIHEPGVKNKTIYNSGSVINILLYTVLPLVSISLLVALVFWLYRQRRLHDFDQVPTAEPSPMPPPSPNMKLKSVQLIEIKARGRFGAVWKAQMMNEYVAVKILPVQERQSWAVEQEIYTLPQMKNENILSFIGAERRGDNLQAEYWLITAFHEKGSLFDYLKANLVTWPELCHIADSITKGLTYLHEELPATKLDAYKPAIAHRDFKSKNVLLKSDLTACIADFGLAILFHQCIPAGDAHGQVGTRRYMAPEVLEGAINFQRDAFLRIDMYACGLVLWELATRCSAQEGPIEEYMLPFEDEVGQHPSLEDMQDVVTLKKLRPKFKDQLKKNPYLGMLSETIEECWDHDAEARLSASCVQERISHLVRMSITSNSLPNNNCCRYPPLNTTTTSCNKFLSPTIIMPLPPKESSF
ncbi:hypothetical protein CHUAL_010428 [Chamberlinius hualienensis]